ncbi:CBS domain-containing protein [Thermodesulfobacteriota bacterium]
MSEREAATCVPVDISDEDIYDAMSEIPGYLDITPGDFKEVYLRAYEHALLRLTRSVEVAKVMTTDVLSVARDTSIREVAELMATRRVSGVPVVEADGTVAGVISEKDFLAAMGAEKAGTFMEVVADCLRGSGCLAAPMRTRLAEDLMSAPAITAQPSTPLMEVANIMAKRGINRVPIIDERGRLIGLASRADVVQSSLVG